MLFYPVLPLLLAQRLGPPCPPGRKTSQLCLIRGRRCVTSRAARGLLIGTAVSPAGFFDPPYQSLLARHFSLVVPDYGGYMTDIRPTPDHWDFWALDQVVAGAVKADQRVRGHALVFAIPPGHDMFGGWTPTSSWVHDAHLSRSAALGVLQEYIETVLAHYAGKIDSWIVVNEPLGSQFGARRVDGVLLSPTVWLEQIGPDYIKLAFEYARAADPSVKLIINEWGADYVGQDYNRHNRRQEYYKLVRWLLNQGTPLDGVGFQFHLEPGMDFPKSDAVVENLERFAALGVSTHITEMDVRVKGSVTPKKLKRQAALYSNAVYGALKSPSLADITFWGFTDRYSWITAGTSFQGYGAGTLMSSDLRLYPAMASVRKRLAAAE